MMMMMMMMTVMIVVAVTCSGQQRMTMTEVSASMLSRLHTISSTHSLHAHTYRQPLTYTRSSVIRWFSDERIGLLTQRSRVRAPAAALSSNNLGQVVHTYVPLSLSSISCYQCKNQGGNGWLWKWCSLLFITLGASPLPAQDHGNGDEHCTLTSYSLCLQLYWPAGFYLHFIACCYH